MNTRQITVSYGYATSNETRPCGADEVLKAIRDGGKGEKLKGKITQIRNRFDLESQVFPNDLKKAKESIAELKRALPGVLWSGTFTERKNSALIQHSGLLCADLDDLGDSLEDVHTTLRRSPHIRALFISPTATGLKAVFCVHADASKHLASFRAIEKHVQELAGVQIDESCKDPARLCFMSYDPELFYNPGAKEIEPLPEPERPARTSNGAVDLNERQRIATEILGAIDWQSDTSGVVNCPGKNLHTTGDNGRDCMIELDNVPTLHCFHNSCRGIVDGVNHMLRSRIGKVEYVPASETRSLRESEATEATEGREAIVAPVSAAAPYVSPPLDLLPESLQQYVILQRRALTWMLLTSCCHCLVR
jgi:hypothetical protein